MAVTTFKDFVKAEPPAQPKVVKGRSLMSEMMAGDTTTLSANVIQGVQANQGRLKSIVRGSEEEQEPSMTKIELARRIFNAMLHAPNASRKQIIHTMMKRAHVTHSTAVSYYERIAKEAGITNTDQFDQGGPPATGGAGFGPAQTLSAGDAANLPAQGQIPEEPEQDEPGEIQHTYPDDPKRQGIIRTVPNAHLVYKVQTPEGTFEELWIYNVGPDMRDELKVRREILAGTDIPSQKTQSPDGQQSYSLSTMGNAQLLSIKGLSQ